MSTNPYRDTRDTAEMSTGSWWHAPQGQAHAFIYTKAQQIESKQSEYYDRLLKLACLYDPFESLGHDDNALENAPGRNADVQENVCAENVDTVAAIIAKWEGRAVFQTDDGDWSTQRQAVQLERYAAGIVARSKVHDVCRKVFKDGAVLGTGYAKVYACDGTIRVDRVLADEIIIDQAECRTGKPRQMFHRVRVDADALIADFPDHEREILASRGTSGGQSRWAGYLQIAPNEVMLLEAWRLPVGKKGTRGYKPGRRVLAVYGCSLLDEEYERPCFPFAVFRWAERLTGHQGIGLVEGLAGHQREINTLNLQEGAILDTNALPTTFVPITEMDTVRNFRETAIGRLVPFRSRMPTTITPQGLTDQLAARREQLKASAFERTGVSRMSAHGMKPPGLDSGAAQREYRDITTERFALQEKAFEQLFLDTVQLCLLIAKEMDADGEAPVISYRTAYLAKQIEWADVDMRDVAVQIQAANSLSKTLAGRMQTVIEWAQAGVITQDEARRLMEHPDLASTLSLYNAAREDLERCIEAILDGEQLVPEPYQNLKMGVWMFQMSYLKARANGAPDDVLENLRTWIVQAGKMLEVASQPAPGPMPMGPGAAAAMPGAPVEPPAMPMAPPMGGAPVAAFAPQAMQVMPT